MTTLFYAQEPIGAIRARDFLFTERQDASKLARGRDKSGKPWQLVLPAPTHGLWESDRGGARTYYFAGYTGGAGMAPGTWIVALSFDEQARPVPFYLNSYGAYDDKGITDLLDLDPTGPVLLQQDWLETNWAPHTRSGFFITAAYQQRGNYWYRADGRHGSNVFPVFEKRALLPNNLPQRVEFSTAFTNMLSDYGNDPRTGIKARIVGLDDRGIHTEQLGCELQFINVIVEDSRTGREIDADRFSARDPGRPLPEIARRRARVALTGLKRWPDDRKCDATIIWTKVE